MTRHCINRRLGTKTCCSCLVPGSQIKKSSFVVTAWPLDRGTGKQALEFIRSVSDPDATHNCWGEVVMHALLYLMMF